MFTDNLRDDYRRILEPDSKLIHTFDTSTHYEAMTIYYKMMSWRIYTTEIEMDKEPYEKNRIL